jgi:hypothetical protein
VSPDVPRQAFIRLRRPETSEDVRSGAGSEKTVRAVARQQLVPELLFERNLAGEHGGGEQPFEQVVVPAVPFSPRETEDAGDGVRLEHGAYGVGRQPEPVGRRPALTLEVARGQWAVRSDPLQHPRGDVRVLGQGPRRADAQVPAEPRELAHRHQ